MLIFLNKLKFTCSSNSFLNSFIMVTPIKTGVRINADDFIMVQYC